MKAQLFVTCLVDSLFPEVGEAVVETLAKAGVKLEFLAEQTCCGQPAFNAGFREEARQMALHMLDVYEKGDGVEGDMPIIIPSGSCAGMVKHGYLELFKDDPKNLGRAQKLARRVYEYSEFLVDILGTTQFDTAKREPTAYHPSCHQIREMGIRSQPLTLLAESGVPTAPLEEVCCGFGGVFAIDQPEISGEMLRRKIETIRESGARTVAACDVSCLMHIEGGLRRAGLPMRCSHLAQVLAGRPAGLR